MPNKIGRLFYRLACWFFCLFPLKKNVVFLSNFNGKSYGDNIKYACESLRDKNASLNFVLMVDQTYPLDVVPSYIRQVKKNSIKCAFYLSRTPVIISNVRMVYFKKRKEQFYIQTWHGGGGQKKCEADVADKLGEKYIKMAQKDSKKTDLMISESRFITELYHKSFWYDGPVYECGYPRYDVLLSNDHSIRKRVCDYYSLPQGIGFVLYAPTFRADGSFKAYNIDFCRLLKNLKQRFGKEFAVLVHLHPNVASVKGGIKYNERVINATFYPDMQELIACSDVLIGDYSSVNYDFCLQEKPVFRYVMDLKDYQNDRDTYYPFTDYPYPYALNNDELEQIILEFDEEEYLKGLNDLFDRLGAVRANDASAKVASVICDMISSKNKKSFFQKNKQLFVWKEKEQ